MAFLSKCDLQVPFKAESEFASDNQRTPSHLSQNFTTIERWARRLLAECLTSDCCCDWNTLIVLSLVSGEEGWNGFTGWIPVPRDTTLKSINIMLPDVATDDVTFEFYTARMSTFVATLQFTITIPASEISSGTYVLSPPLRFLQDDHIFGGILGGAPADGPTPVWFTFNDCAEGEPPTEVVVV